MPVTPVSSRTVCRILARNGLHDRIAAQKPALNKRQLRNHVAYAKAHSPAEGWTAEDSCLPVHSQLQEESDFSTGWSSLPYLRFHYEVSQGEEDQGPSGMASTVSRY